MSDFEDKHLDFVLKHYQEGKFDTQKAIRRFNEAHGIVQQPRRRVMPWVSGIVAAAAAVVVCVFLFLDSNRQIQLMADAEVQEFVLPDGSEVTLAPGSRLTYKEKSPRKTMLEGKAFFEVERDESVPFEVTSDGSFVRVLGTKFMVDAGTQVKEVLTDENLELLRDKCKNIRDLAIIDLLSSTGIRVGELVKLNRNDINFAERECIVFGKGNKERIVYFNARAKIHLQEYLKTRKDKNQALFVSLAKPHTRLQISGVETRLRELGRRVKLPRVHPHKFRRTLATMAIDKGMPVEQVQKLLGHVKIDTTMHYAMVNQTNVKLSHRKFIG
jgi:integrase